MSKWKPDFVKMVLGPKQKKWTRTIGRNYERANVVLRSSRRLNNASLHKLLPKATREKILELTSQIISNENIISGFDNVFIECKTN